MPRMMIELDEARPSLKPLEPTLIYGLTSAAKKWGTLLEERPDCVLPLNSTTRAGFIHDHACAVIEQGVGPMANITIPDKLDFFALLINNSILLRVKFVGGGVPRNYPTKQQRSLAKQQFPTETMQTLEGLATPPTLLTCGYTLDATTIGRIEIRRDCEGHQPWMYDIYGGEATATPLVIPGMIDTTKPAIVTSTEEQKASDDKRAEQG